MKPFCEIIVADIMPAIRSIITNELVRTYHLSQVSVSKKLGVTQPAVSQYLRALRGTNVKIIQSDQDVMSMISKLAKDIATGDVDPKFMHRGLCAICKKIREDGLVCKLHFKDHAGKGKGGCDICF
jgi:uncharacterized protein